jgi:hypothetical protein
MGTGSRVLVLSFLVEGREDGGSFRGFAEKRQEAQ